MEHVSRKGDHRIVETRTSPLTGKRRVQWIITGLAVLDVTERGLLLVETAPDVTGDEVRTKTGAELRARADASEPPGTRRAPSAVRRTADRYPVGADVII